MTSIRINDTQEGKKRLHPNIEFVTNHCLRITHKYHTLLDLFPGASDGNFSIEVGSREDKSARKNQEKRRKTWRTLR